MKGLDYVSVIGGPNLDVCKEFIEQDFLRIKCYFGGTEFGNRYFAFSQVDIGDYPYALPCVALEHSCPMAVYIYKISDGLDNGKFRKIVVSYPELPKPDDSWETTLSERVLHMVQRVIEDPVGCGVQTGLVVPQKLSIDCIERNGNLYLE